MIAGDASGFTSVPGDRLIATPDDLVTTQLQQLLSDLRLIVPYDVAAAWLGHDDRPSLRVVSPEGAHLPSLESARHAIFQATAEAARIPDLQNYPGGKDTGLRSWLGVPLILHGRRRGWIELLSAQPNWFSEVDVQRVEVVVRHAALALAQLEIATHVGRESEIQRRLLAGIEQALLAPKLEDALHTLLETIGDSNHAEAASLVLPAELAYALGFHTSIADVPDSTARIESEGLITVVARWSRDEPDGASPISDRAAAPSDPAPDGNTGAMFPLVQAGETIGWLTLQYPPHHLLAGVEQAALPQMTAIVAALLLWLREQVEREQQAQQSVRMLAQMAYQERSGSIGALLGGFAHELAPLLDTMRGTIESLRHGAVSPEAIGAEINALATGMERMNTLIARISGFGDTGDTQKMPLPLNDVVADALAVINGLAQQRGIAINTLLPAHSPAVLGNRARLQHACLELLTNALDAVATGDDPCVTVEVRCDGSWALVLIGDNGYGIPDDLRERIFTPGLTTRTAVGSRRGLGLGLPMALDIARDHGGTIAVESQLWHGSRFTLRLPRLDDHDC